MTGYKYHMAVRSQMMVHVINAVYVVMGIIILALVRVEEAVLGADQFAVPPPQAARG